MVGETGIRVGAALIILCGLGAATVLTINQHNEKGVESGITRMAEMVPEAIRPVFGGFVAGGAGNVAAEGGDYETLDYNVRYPRMLTAREHDTPGSTVWRKIWLANPGLGTPDGLGTYNEDYSKLSRIEDGIHAAI